MANVQLAFFMQHQKENNWCWAATASSISEYYDANSDWSQCKVATHCRNRPCCTAPTSVECNVPWFLHNALGSTGNLNSRRSNPLTFDDIQTEIIGQRPIGVRIGWSSGDGHFVVIDGYNDTNDSLFLYVQDPLYGKNYVEFSEFTNSYRSSGNWTHSYLTCQNSGGNVLTFTTINDELLTRAKSLTPELMLNDQSNQNKKFTFPTNLDIPMALPHDVYVIDFNSLLTGVGSPTMRNVGTRLIDQTINGYFTYEFDGVGKSAQLKQVYLEKTYNEKFIDAVYEAVTKYGPTKNQYHLRLVRQPELKVEALYLYKLNNVHESIFIPIYEGNTLERGRIYNNADFYHSLKISAKDHKISNDPLIGG